MVRRPKRKPGKRKPPAVAPAAPPPVAPADVGVERAQTTNKIFPRNLTAQAAYLVPGNPVTTRPEDAVANCFPGLEIDIRNLDRRFFPGLVFEFVKGGARLAYVDVYEDPDLKADTPEAQRLYLKLANDLLDELSDGIWFLEWVEQKGKRLSMSWQGSPMDDTEVWRFIRSLELGPLTIGLKRRLTSDGKKDRRQPTVTLQGWRRRFTDEVTGVISSAYQPGELMQGLCSPWQHDFRDCACFYWAANHPDIVLGEAYPGESLADSMEEPTLETIPLDWLRADRQPSQAAEALETIEKNRPYQLDHFQVNKAWQDLSIIVEGREIGGLYVPQTMDTANPFRSPAELADELRNRLAPLEIALAFEYLYARLSLISEEQAKREDEALYGAVLLARERLLLVAASEMQHLRWVNQMLWDLMQVGLIVDRNFSPALTPATEIPTVTARPLDPSLGAVNAPQPIKPPDRKQKLTQAVDRFITAERKRDAANPAEGEPRHPAAALVQAGAAHRLDTVRPAELRALSKDVLDEFIAVEHPSAFIDGAYARVIATLREPLYPSHLVELALRIAGDGVQHETRFLEIKNALSPFANNQKYLRNNFKEATPDQAKDARAPLRAIKQNLRSAYIAAAQNQNVRSAENVTQARQAMNELLKIAETLAGRRNCGVPFFKLWNEIP